MASTPSWWAMSGSERLGALVGHDGGARDDAKIGDTGEFGDEFVGHAVGEVLLARVAGEILKRQHGNRADGGATVSMEEAGSQRMGTESEYRDEDEDGGAQSDDQRKSMPRFAGNRRDGRLSRPQQTGISGGGAIRPEEQILDRRLGKLGRPGDLWLKLCNGCDEPVTGAGDCLHIQRQVRAVAQNLADFANCRVDSVFDIDEDFPVP